MNLLFNHLSDAVGSEVSGLDLSKPLDTDNIELIRSTFHDRGVLLFRDQHLNEEQHIAFSRRFGDLEIHIAKQYLLEGHPEIVVLSNKVIDGKPVGIEDAGRFWHSDLSYVPNPSLGSLLYAHEVPPPEAGGNTPYASMYAAYDALDDSLKQRLQGLNAIHSYEQRWQKDAERGMDREKLNDNDRKRIPEVSHPIVRPHPITGRLALYVNEGFTVRIESLPDNESQSLLEELFAHSTQEEFVYSHQWQANDLVMWDNRCALHRGRPWDPIYPRVMHRTTVAGIGRTA